MRAYRCEESYRESMYRVVGSMRLITQLDSLVDAKQTEQAASCLFSGGTSSGELNRDELKTLQLWAGDSCCQVQGSRCERCIDEKAMDSWSYEILYTGNIVSEKE